MSKSTPQLTVCLGFCVLSSGKKGILFQPVSGIPLSNDGPTLCYSSKIKGWAGITYTLNIEDDSIVGQPVFEGPWHNEEERSAMCIKSRAVDTEFATKAREKKESTSMEHVLACLKPLRDNYHSTNAAGKAAIIAQVITFMQRR